MKIKCKCGRSLKLSMEKHAGKKVACKECGQRYRLPPRKERAAKGTVQMEAWKDEEKTETDQAEKKPQEVGAVALGESISFTWILLSILLTLGVGIGGAIGVKVGMPKLTSGHAVGYAKLALWWGPSLAFVIAGWITARLSPGKTITEPAFGAAIAVAIMVALVLFQPGPVAGFLEGIHTPDRVTQASTAAKANLFALAMFNAGLMACAGAYFGEVAQDRSRV